MEHPTIRGRDMARLGGLATTGGSAARYIYCGHCSPEPLNARTAVRFRTRKNGLTLDCEPEQSFDVDLLECPECGHQILR